MVEELLRSNKELNYYVIRLVSKITLLLILECALETLWLVRHRWSNYCFNVSISVYGLTGGLMEESGGLTYGLMDGLTD